MSPRAMQHSQPARLSANHLVAEALLSAKHPHMTSHTAELPSTTRLKSPKSIIAGDRSRSLSSPCPRDSITGERYEQPAAGIPLSQSLPLRAWQQPLPVRHTQQQVQQVQQVQLVQDQQEEVQPPPGACELKPDADRLRRLELPDVAAALRQAGLTEGLLAAAGLSSDMVSK